MSQGFLVKVDTKSQRRQRYCGHCRGLMLVGTPATKVVGVFEGDFYRWHSHQDCKKAWDALYLFRNLEYWEGQPPICNIEDINECKEFLFDRFPEVALRIYPNTIMYKLYLQDGTMINMTCSSEFSMFTKWVAKHDRYTGSTLVHTDTGMGQHRGGEGSP